MAIVMKDFDDRRVKEWLYLPDKYGLKHEPAVGFVCAWIAFNYVYGLYCRQYSGKLRTLAEKGSEDKIGDREQWRFFVGQPELEAIFNEIKLGKNSKQIFDVEMPKRITDLLWGHPHPKRAPVGRFSLRTLTALEFFDLLYTIRNNLFHGGKKVDNNEDRTILEVASSSLTNFMMELLDHIEAI